MMQRTLLPLLALLASPALAQTPSASPPTVASPAATARTWASTDGVFTIRDFAFKSGERLPELRVGYTTLGTPRRNVKGEVDNAVMVLHGTGGSGKSFLVPQFADELYGPGAPLDITRWYVILPDSIGHGRSSKPSNGLKMQFPKYDYDDMVEAQRRLLVDGLGVKHLQLLLGTSMGCMQGFVWGTTHPGFARRLAPFACNAMAIAGRNRMWRRMSIDAIKADLAWRGGEYTEQPKNGLLAYTHMSIIAGANPVALQAQYPTREAAERFLGESVARRMQGVDANDAIYQLDSSRNYDPSAGLERITVPVLWINSADDFINPPELGTAEASAKRMPRARFVLIPASADTKGHGTHTWGRFWKADLARLLAEPAP